ncbi:MAG TPA: hypothetical protein VGP91_18390 [Actinoplanes sp.]|jgi:D-xylose transport system permease protein|nr:hypothetical protein [Actinoplanes sp.]
MWNGFVNWLRFLIITSAGIPSFIITLAGLLVWQGVQLALVGEGGQIPIRDPFVRSIASTYAVPAAGWVLAAVKNIATGVILVVAVVIDSLGRRRRLARGGTE